MIKYLTLFLLLLGATSFGQQKFSLDEAVTYALEHHSSVKNAEIDILDAELQIEELKRTGLPQINGQFAYTYNPIIPTQLLEAKNFNPAAADGELVEFKFGVPYGGQAGIALSQLIFDGSYLVGLRAAATYRKLATQSILKTKEDVTVNVIKAYYSVLVSEERFKLLDLNLDRLSTMINEMTALNKQGFIEQIDVDRLSVQKNNLLTEKTKTRALIDLSYQLLKFQMQMKLNEEITLTDQLGDQEIQAYKAISLEDVKPEDRIEFNLLDTQKSLNQLNIERYQKGYLPSVSLSANLGASHSSVKFTPFQNWFGSSAITLGVNIPLFDSGLKRQKINREKLSLQKLNLSEETMVAGFQLENQQAYINLKNGIENLETQKRNLDLAKEIVRVSTIKFKEGLGSNLEISQAENDLRQSETNYFAALYDVIISKIDLDKAQGKLVKQ